METISLSNLISFSQDNWACTQFFSLNGFDRLFSLLSNIKPTPTLTDTQKLIIELSLLLLSNLTQSREGVLKFLHMEEKDHLGVHFIFLFDLFLNPKLREVYKFVGNVFSNVTAVKEARDLLIKPEYKAISSLMLVVDTPIRDARMGALHTLRNLVFEYENLSALEQIIEERTQFIDTLVHLMVTIARSADIEQQAKNELQEFDGDQNTWKDVKFLEEITTVLDIILVLTNVQEIEKKVKFNSEKLAKTLGILKSLVPSEIKDKIDVILCIFCQIAP